MVMHNFNDGPVFEEESFLIYGYKENTHPEEPDKGKEFQTAIRFSFADNDVFFLDINGFSTDHDSNDWPVQKLLSSKIIFHRSQVKIMVAALQEILRHAEICELRKKP